MLGLLCNQTRNQTSFTPSYRNTDFAPWVASSLRNLAALTFVGLDVQTHPGEVLKYIYIYAYSEHNNSV